MRTVTYESVLHAALRRIGLDPLGDAIRYDTARAMTEHINNAIQYAWEIIEWPELMITEERAFRDIWRSTAQYRRLNSQGKPDEIFYLPSSGYYAVKPTAPSDPPPGTLPTNATYFVALTPLDMFIAADQPGRQSIGQVFGVYGSNPRTSAATGYKFRASERGVDIQPGGLPTVWVHYRLRPSKFSAVPWADGHAYKYRDLVYDPATGECYVAVTDNTGPPTNAPVYWRKVPFPEFLKPFVVAQAAGAALLEWNPTDASPDMIVARMRLAGALQNEAQIYLEQQYIRAVEQGYRAYYSLANRAYGLRLGWCPSVPCYIGSWVSAAAASTLSNAVLDEWGQSDDDVENDMQTQGFLLSLVNGQPYLDFTFTTPKVDGAGNPTSEWEFENMLIENTVDANPLLLFANLVSRTPSGGRILLSAAPDSGNYRFRARVRVPLLT